MQPAWCSRHDAGIGSHRIESLHCTEPALLLTASLHCSDSEPQRQPTSRHQVMGQKQRTQQCLDLETPAADSCSCGAHRSCLLEEEGGLLKAAGNVDVGEHNNTKACGDGGRNGAAAQLRSQQKEAVRGPGQAVLRRLKARRAASGSGWQRNCTEPAERAAGCLASSAGTPQSGSPATHQRQTGQHWTRSGH